MEVLRTNSRGPLVELLQSNLRRLGFMTGGLDGIFGSITANAVMAFQRASGLVADGVVGSSTWNALMPYINGYDHHTTVQGDTLFAIAQRYGTSVDRILAANPGIDPYNLFPGIRLIVPFRQVVPTDVSYSYDILTMNIQALSIIYPFLRTGTIGNSETCRKLYYIRIGTGAKEVFYNAAFHANEWITTPVLMKFTENFARAYAENTSIYGVNDRRLARDVSIYIVPMVNPDGVDLVTGVIGPGSALYAQAARIASSFPAIPFPGGWKANIQGTDLNLQFPAGWENAKEIKYAQGFTRPAPRDYVGPYALSAAESQAVYHFTLEHHFSLIMAYHSQGRIIYWKFLDYEPPRSYEIGRRLSDSSGYVLDETPYASGFAGYKDWFIQENNKPGYTIEVGLGVSPLPIAQFDTIYKENEGMLILAAVLA